MLRARGPWALALALASPLGCLASPAEDARCESAALLRAQADQDTPAVCRVLIGEHATCSGALVASDTVLTAKHCVQPAGHELPISASELSVVFGTNAAQPDLERAVTVVQATPGSYTIDAHGQLHGALLGHDLALLTLDEEVPAIAPLALDLSGAFLAPGGSFLALGFGRDEQGGSGVREVKQVTVTRLSPELLFVGPDLCSGDSGGPLLSPEGRVVGVASATYGECGTSETTYTRVDARSEFLRDSLGAPRGSCGR
jgi:secreted trypsin-like serine protease